MNTMGTITNSRNGAYRDDPHKPIGPIVRIVFILPIVM